jgi:hypothetical protein
MLLILFAERDVRKGARQGRWWSVDKFPEWYGISASMRAKGTKELVDYGLIQVRKQMIDTGQGGNNNGRDRVRNLYHLTDLALGTQ